MLRWHKNCQRLFIKRIQSCLAPHQFIELKCIRKIIVSLEMIEKIEMIFGYIKFVQMLMNSNFYSNFIFLFIENKMWLLINGD